MGGAQILARPLPVWGSMGYISRGPAVAPGRADVFESTLHSIERVARTKRRLLLAMSRQRMRPSTQIPCRHGGSGQQFLPDPTKHSTRRSTTQ